MNMVSESDLPRLVSGPMQNAPAGLRRGWSGGSMRSSFTTAPAGPGAAGSADPEERLEWRQKVNIFKATYSFIAMTDAAD